MISLNIYWLNISEFAWIALSENFYNANARAFSVPTSLASNAFIYARCSLVLRARSVDGHLGDNFFSSYTLASDANFARKALSQGNRT